MRTSRWIATVGMVGVAALAACGSSNGSSDGGAGGGDQSSTASDLAGTSAAPDLLGVPSTPAGSISGSVGGTAFASVATSLWLGAPDDPATTVVYVFDHAVKCSDLATMGWDRRITDKTQVLEMKMFGVAPATYTVTTRLTPARGEAAVNYTLSSRAGVPNEMGGAGGTVTLSTVSAMTSVSGTFAIDFGGGDKLAGSYSATFCPGGHEP